MDKDVEIHEDEDKELDWGGPDVMMLDPIIGSSCKDGWPDFLPKVQATHSNE